MSLILGKDGIQKLMVGYPTVSDKYNVGPAVAEGTIYPGDLVVLGNGGHSSYVAATSTAAAPMGFAIATNVKVPGTYPAPQGPVPFQAGEAFGLFVSGYLAVQLDASAVMNDVVEGAPMYIAASGKLTTVTPTKGFQLVGNFTGVKEMHGTAKVAEIFVPYMGVIALGE